MSLRVLLVCEGTSDVELLPHIQRLLVQNGTVDTVTESWTRGRFLSQKIREGLRWYGVCDLLFVHRDADSQENTVSAGPVKRYQEIKSAIEEAGYDGHWVGVVPVHSTESWLLLDSSAIRRVVGFPNSSVHLNLPSPLRAEEEPDPKQVLRTALETASEFSGRRLAKLRRDFPHFRRILLEGLPVGGPLELVPSWARFRDDTAAILRQMREQ